MSHPVRAPFVAVVAACAIASAGAFVARDAGAAGLYFTDRGVRPLGRGGAFVAGADDLGAVWYNPAGLADAGSTVLVDASWLHFTSEFTRKTQVLDAQGTVRTYTFPTVNGTTPVLPIPTIGGSYNFGEKKEYTFAVAVLAPYTAIATYPSAVDGQPSPSRYSLLTMDGSALVSIGTYFAFKPIEQIRIGAGLGALVGQFASTVTFSASPPDRLIGAPEDPKYDATSQLNAGPIFSPSANIGATIVPDEHVRLGVAYSLPHIVNAPGKIQVRLPNAVEFDNASVVGDKVHVKFELPAIFRVGLEVRPVKALRLEAAYVREFWSTHHEIDIEPDDLALAGVTGFPTPFKVSPIHLPRNFDNSNSYRFGGEATVPIAGYDWDLRLGVNYDQSAIPSAYLSPLTIDLDRVTLGMGLGLHVDKHWRLDGVYAHVFAMDREVDPAQAAVPRVNPVIGNPTQTEAINGGTYSARADVVGVGVQYTF